MRESAVKTYLKHDEISCLQLTRIEGDCSQHPLEKAFLSWPTASSALTQGGQPPPATPGHNLRVDLRNPSDVQARVRLLNLLDALRVGHNGPPYKLCRLLLSWLGRPHIRCPQRSLQAACAALGKRHPAQVALGSRPEQTGTQTVGVVGPGPGG